MKHESNAIDQNCLQCCLAMAVGLPLKDVPTVHAWTKSHGYWFTGMQEWLRGLKMDVVAVTDDTLDEVFHIFVSTEGVAHSVLAQGDRVVWDPHPTKKITTLPTDGYSLLLLDMKGDVIQGRLAAINTEG